MDEKADLHHVELGGKGKTVSEGGEILGEWLTFLQKV